MNDNSESPRFSYGPPGFNLFAESAAKAHELGNAIGDYVTDIESLEASAEKVRSRPQLSPYDVRLAEKLTREAQGAREELSRQVQEHNAQKNKVLEEHIGVGVPLDPNGSTVTPKDKSVDQAEDVDEQLEAVMAQPHRPVAAVASPSEPLRMDSERMAHEVGRSYWMGDLKREVLKNGDISYSLPMDPLREAFRECNPLSDRTHIEVTGTSDRHMAAAMAFAARKWGDNEVIIRVDELHRDKIIQHAVRAGLNIANQNPELQKIVAAERERQRTQIAPDPARVKTPGRAPENAKVRCVGC